MHSKDITPLTIRELLSEARYLIPIYQRNYDWGERESLQLIQDISDYASTKKDKKYYIGSLVVFVRNKDGQEYFETIDGQQRLTTLTILMNVLRGIPEVKEKMGWFHPGRLTYDHRPESDDALLMLFHEQYSEHPSAASIVDVYRVIKKNLKNTLDDKSLDINDFVDYLLSKVIIMRIPVPKDTELNHYFEIMNSRGEQLEKHEVLKAGLMDAIADKNCHVLFHEIWEACSSLTSYVQMNFKPKVRSLIFTENWADLQPFKFDDLNKQFLLLDNNGSEDDEENGYLSRTLSQLFDDAAENIKYRLPDSDDNDEGNDRFGSIINFSNFLLHALKVMYHNDPEYDEEVDNEIRLDDKRLIDIFNLVLSRCKDRASFAKRFIMSLLHMRWLFDKYIIKRETYNGKEGWSLKSVKKYEKSKVNFIGTFSKVDLEDDDDSRDIRMLEAMFHVSAPTQIYKHWMNAILYYVYNQKEGVYQDQFRDYLYSLACAYMLDRYLCSKENHVDFEDIIYKNNAIASRSAINWCMIDNGCSVENFVFNFYDYVTWKNNTRKYSKFDFTYRTSVEHFYPQTPMPGYKVLTDETGLNDFGNLCLISRGMNSKFSNNMPVAKYKNFGNEAMAQELSLKLNEMMDVVQEKGDWGTAEIKDFEVKAKERILSAIETGTGKEISTID